MPAKHPYFFSTLGLQMIKKSPQSFHRMRAKIRATQNELGDIWPRVEDAGQFIIANPSIGDLQLSDGNELEQRFDLNRGGRSESAPSQGVGASDGEGAESGQRFLPWLGCGRRKTIVLTVVAKSQFTQIRVPRMSQLLCKTGVGGSIRSLGGEALTCLWIRDGSRRCVESVDWWPTGARALVGPRGSHTDRPFLGRQLKMQTREGVERWGDITNVGSRGI